MKNKLIILGCGSSVGSPRIDGFWGKCNKNVKRNFRTRCSAIIMKGTNSVLIDSSPDIKYQLLKNKIKNISSVLITHDHADQTNGLFELRPFYWKSNKKINIYADNYTIKKLKLRMEYLFKEINSYKPILKANFVKKNFSLGYSKEKIIFKTIKVKHGQVNCTAYIFEKTAYISDCNDFSIVKKKEFQKLRFLIIDCLKLSKHPSHFNLSDAIYVHDMLKPEKTILTNLHHDLDYNYLVNKLPKNIVPAYDGLTINL